MLLFSHYAISNFFATASLLCPWDFPDKDTGVGCYFLFQGPRDIPDPGIKPASPALAGGCFTTASPGKPYPCNAGRLTGKPEPLKVCLLCARH